MDGHAYIGEQFSGVFFVIAGARLLLWGLFGALQVGLSIVILFQYAAFEEASVFTAGWDRLYGAFSMASVAMIWFAFFPPAFYRRWIESSTDTSAAERG